MSRLPCVLAGVVALVSSTLATQAPPKPSVTRIDAFHNLDGQAFSDAGKGKDYLRLHVENAPGPCLRVPRDFTLVHSGGKQTRAMTVAFANVSDFSRDAVCETFDVIFPPLPRGTRPASLRVKDAVIDATAPPVRTELHAAFLAGHVSLSLTPTDEGKTLEAVVRSVAGAPLTLYVGDNGGAYSAPPPHFSIVLLAPDRQDIDLPPGGEITLRFANRERNPLTAPLTLTPTPEK